MSKLRFSQYAWGVLVYNIVVTLWGAFVRASISGDGCGPHWPLCNGEVIPTNHQVHTAIEFTHRVSIGLVTPLLILLIVWAFRAFPKKHSVRLGAVLTFLFTVAEAFIGALLVKYHLVAHDQSMTRAVVMALHLVNTLLLLASLTLTAWWSSQKDEDAAIRWNGQGAIGYGLLLAILATLTLSVSGAVTALGDTLFPAHSLTEGLMQDFSPTAHVLLRLRILHPLIAMSVGLYLLLLAGLLSHLRPSVAVKRFARGIITIFLAEIVIGGANVLMGAPIPMQLIHLYIAELLWLNVVLLTAAALAKSVPQVELSAFGSAAATPVAPQIGVGQATWKDYLALTKPRVISLLLFTTLAAMFIASDAHHPISIFLFVAVALGGYMAAGSANAVNMVIDRDIDGLMERTTQRPTVTQKISSRNALLFAFVLEMLSFTLLWGAANLLSAMLALAGLVFYIIIYTMMLKRRTWQNIVIGGAAGAFPPLVGWAAVTGNLSPLAWYLFAIIFVWTPVHFWALALLLKDDYASAGIPMLPVVRGERVTVIQIGLYTILTAVVSIMPILQQEHQLGILYLCAAILLNATLLVRSLQLFLKPDRPHASTLFHFSMLYLALLFLMMAVDRTAIVHGFSADAWTPAHKAQGTGKIVAPATVGKNNIGKTPHLIGRASEKPLA